MKSVLELPGINFFKHRFSVKKEFSSYWMLLQTAVLFMLLMVNIDIGYNDFFQGINGIWEIVLMAGIFCLIRWRTGIRDKRAKICSFVCGSLLALCYVLGYNIERYQDLWGNREINLSLALKFLGISYVFSSFILGLFLLFNKAEKKEINCRIRHVSLYAFICMLLFLAWLPSFCINFPGALVADSYNAIYMASGIEKMSTHHTLAFVLLIRLCLFAADTVDHAVLVYTIVSLIVNLLNLSYIIFYMVVNKWDRRAAAAALLVFMFYPSIQLFVFTMDKDIFFASSTGVFVISLIDFLYEKRFRKNNIYILILSSLGVVLFRKNGIYIVLFTMAGLFLIKNFNRKEKRKILLICAGAAAVQILFEAAAVNLFGVSKGSPREMLSLPLQQMARICKNVPDIDTDLKAEINYYFKDEVDFETEYYPLISDNIKSHFSEKNFEHHEFQFIKTAVKLLFLYPQESIEAYMCQSYGYWYPTPVNWYGVRKKDGADSYDQYISRHEYPETVVFCYFDTLKNLPVVKSVSNIAVFYWLLLCMLFYFIYRRNYVYITAFIPMAALWLTSAASPVWNEQRYILGLYITVPILAGMTIHVVQKGKGMQGEEK